MAAIAREAKTRGPVAGTVALLLLGWLAGASAAPTPRVVTLTQTGCQFLEPEGEDHEFAPLSKADCDRINDRTGKERLKASTTLRLPPGRYVFKITNQNVPYELGFWLRGDGLIARATLPSVSGGGIEPGQTRAYEIDLEPGQYRFSCPLNPTPDYRLEVTERP